MTEIKTLKQFYDIVEQGDKAIIYWYTKWCPDCFAIKPHLPRLEQEFDSFAWYKIDRDVDIDLAKHLEIFGIPSFLAFKNGLEIGRFVDKKRKTYDQVKTFLTELES